MSEPTDRDNVVRVRPQPIIQGNGTYTTRGGQLAFIDGSEHFHGKVVFTGYITTRVGLREAVNERHLWFANGTLAEFPRPADNSLTIIERV